MGGGSSEEEPHIPVQVKHLYKTDVPMTSGALDNPIRNVQFTAVVGDRRSIQSMKLGAINVH